MIYGVTGLLGGGKSLHCVMMMVEHLGRGGVAISNIELNLAQVEKITGNPVKEGQFILIDPEVNNDPWKYPSGDRRGRGSRRVMVCIDEAGEWLSSFDADGRSSWASWLRQTDKRGQDIFLIVQDASILFKQGRVLCHRWRCVSNMSQYRFPGIRLPLPPPWSKMMRVQEFDKTGKQYVGKPFWRFLDRQFFRCYETDALHGSSEKKDSYVNAYESVTDDKQLDENFSGASLFISFLQSINIFFIYRLLTSC